MLEHPHIVNALTDISVLQHLNVPGIPLLNQLLIQCKNSPNIKSAQILEHYRGTEEGQQLAKLMCWQHNIEADAAEAVFEDSIEKLFSRFLELRTEELLQKARLKPNKCNRKTRITNTVKQPIMNNYA